MLPFALPLLALALLTAAGLPAQPVLSRVTATSLQLSANPPSTVYATTRAFPNLSFTRPVALVTPPGENRRLFVVEKTGRIHVIPDVTAPSPTRTVFLDLSARVATSTSANDERGLLALAFHPNFAANGQFYVWYTLNATTGAGSGLHNRLARFHAAAGNPNAADPNSEQPLFTQRDDAGNHNGGEILFGPDGYLYLSVGDEGGANDTLQNSQRIDRDFFAGILRLDVDQRTGSLAPNPHPAVHPGTYAIPPDNPFVGATSFNGAGVNAAAVRTEFWATGLRNPWRMSFDPTSGRLWCADVGQNAREEINIIARGGNYGWNYREGNIAGPRANPPAGTSFIPPVWDYPHSQGRSVTGGLVYRGNRLPGLDGHYLFADFVSGRIWSLQPDGGNPVDAARVQLLATDGGISSFGLDPATGDVLLADLIEGAIKKLVATTEPGGTSFPSTLSATGAFTNLASLTPAPGVVAYEPNVSFWSDHAGKRRWFALTDATATYGFAAEGAWALPPGAVWVKHFDLELTRGDPTTSRRLETRFLVRTTNGVNGLTYRWNEAQTDATLVPDEGAEQDFTVVENGIARAQTWRFPSRSECLGCHTPAGGHALSFNTRQLNRTQELPGGSANLIAALAEAGYLTGAPPAAALSTSSALAPADDPTAGIEHRARSYLDVNCAACHQPGGSAPGLWDARFSSPLSLTGIVDGPLLDHGGNPANRVIVPGDPGHSRILELITQAGVGRMPPLATNEPDLGAAALLSSWIAELAEPPPPARLINLAARAEAGANDKALIAGFVIGPGDGKKILLRAVGPTLANFGIGNPLSEPALTLFQGDQAIAGNTRWATAGNVADIRRVAERVGAFALPESSADSVLLVSLAPGPYTARIEGAGAGSSPGIALMEVYDADDSGSNTRLVNLSVRAETGTGPNTLIAGFVVSAGSPARVLLRGIGPGLAQFGVPSILAQPVVILSSSSQALLSNTAWNTAANAPSIRARSNEVNAFPLEEGSRDSVILAPLSPGAYTLQVTGTGSSTGTVLAEVYETP